MALNPLSYTENIVRSFLRYQLTAYPFADERLHQQMRKLLSLETARQTPLLKGPYISLSRAFRSGATVNALVDDGVLHSHMSQMIPFPAVYGHQEEAIRAIAGGHTTLISTGTGSGKSECFLYPIISRCLALRDEEAPAGICAVIVYPMNALAEDQLGRLRELLAGSGITFGMYVGKTPDDEAGVVGVRLEPGSSREDYRQAVAEQNERKQTIAVHPPEEVCSRQVMRTRGKQPRILLTNVKQLELLLTRQADVELFDNAFLEFLVFDEAHTFTGVQGAETACLIRRLRSFCGHDVGHTVCVATSATIVDQNNPEAARDFASRFFGIPREDVTTVNEAYEPDVWAAWRGVPHSPAEPVKTLGDTLAAIDSPDPGLALRTLWPSLSGQELPAGDWEGALHTSLSANELLYQAAQLLHRPRPLVELLDDLANVVGRSVAEEELILWLTLGAAARRGGRPLVRPVVHGFLRGVPGAVVTFETGNDPTLLLSAEDEDEENEGKWLHLHIAACTTCGQHYFMHSLADFEYAGPAPGGGKAVDDNAVWPSMDETHGGIGVRLLDQLISTEDDEAEEEHRRLSSLFLCRYCGAAHRSESDLCLECGRAGPLVRLFVVQQKKELPGLLSSCVCCGAHGRRHIGRYREPIRQVRAVNVADVHVLAQDMVHHAERKRLLVFADNRQDAAFQAGWMRDHARRFRLRAIMARLLEDKKALSVSDLTHFLDRTLEDDDGLSQALLPEVWNIYPKDAGGAVHREERRYFLRIAVLRELTNTQKQRIGLEPWGRMRVDYVGLNESDEFIQHWSARLNMSATEFREGIAVLLDMDRRRRTLLDRTGLIFTKFWMEGEREIENGYLPLMDDVPKAVKLTREGRDSKSRLYQWLSSTGHRTAVMEIALKWGVIPDEVGTFVGELWAYLTTGGRELMVPVTLTGARGNPVRGTNGSHQIDADRLMLCNNRGVYRCQRCRRRTTRPTPGMKCMAWRCVGTLEYLTEDADSYDLQVLDQDYEMLRPREHTAMVPTSERETLERIFKGETDNINTLVCTQTLELGVDIGALDAVLMRNVPPLPANYWQRAGRAGRRHRMAVNLTYCRSVSHDRSYFKNPVKMLEGRVDPPSFNLSNGLMVAKHVHATVLTRLHQLARPNSGLKEGERTEILNALRTAFPPRITPYLFDENGNVLNRPRDVAVLHTVIAKYQSQIEAAVTAAFRQGWPAEDQLVVEDAVLARHILTMKDALQAIIVRLSRRLNWALEHMQRLEILRQGGIAALNPEMKSFYLRCERLVKRFKGLDAPTNREAEGVDDIATFSVLSVEGFLPGYGLDTGTVVGMAEVPRGVRGLRDFNLPRPPAIALREYVPGNLIYANGQEFVPRRYILNIGEDRQEAVVFEVNSERQAIQEVRGHAAGDISASVVISIPICDVNLVHSSRITDEEENRFQIGVAVFGRELGFHLGGQRYRWGNRDVLLRKGMRYQLVNVGVSSRVQSQADLGYPVCRVCGQSISPFSSQRQREDFVEKHTEWCGQAPTPIAFHADLTVDSLTLPECGSKEVAYSLAESIRFAASDVLDMDLDDLHVLVLGKVDRDEVDAVLYDPMPGGSGLLEHICERFEEIVAEAQRIANDCPSGCGNSCIDCLQRYRNAFYHKYLNRHVILGTLAEWGNQLVDGHAIPPRLPMTTPEPDEQPVNVAERKLQRMLEAAGFSEGRWQERRMLPPPLHSTTPDVTFDDPDQDERKIFIYLDGLSGHLHGKLETREKDIQIRTELRNQDHDVIEITRIDLDDEKAMIRHFKRLSRQLIGRNDLARVETESEHWFAARVEEALEMEEPVSIGEAAVSGFPFEWVENPDRAEMYRTCVPVYTLKAAAGAFSEGQVPEPDGWAKIDVGRTLTEDMFVAQVVGFSMEPRIPNDSWCLFARSVVGSRNNRILVVQHHEIADVETGGSYTIKRYERPPQQAGDGEELRGRIILRPLNRDYEPIVIEDGEENVAVVAEFVQIL